MTIEQDVPIYYHHLTKISSLKSCNDHIHWLGLICIALNVDKSSHNWTIIVDHFC